MKTKRSQWFLKPLRPVHKKGRKILRTATIAARKQRSSERVMPDFLIIGAQRSGTSALFHLLSAHDQIRTPCKVGFTSIKEVHYFDRHYENGEQWYRAHFPVQTEISLGQAVGEATPAYLFHEKAASRIHSDLPDAKLIVLLRDPIERALSNYFSAVRKGYDRRSIEEALLVDEPNDDKALEAGHYLASYTRNSYKARGIYVDQLQHYQHYMDNDRVLVIASERFFDQPHKVLNDVLNFIGVDASVQLNTGPRSNAAERDPQIPDEVLTHLRDFFRPHNERLYAYLGRDLGWQ